MLHTRRHVLLGLAGASLAGCARYPFVGLRDGTPVTSSALSRDYIDALGTPCIAVTVGEDSAPGLMFLTHYDGDDLRWESTNRVRFLTRSGRLIITRGLRRDLIATRYDTADPLLNTDPRRAVGAFTRVVSLTPGDHLDVRYESVLTIGQEETLTILDAPVQTTQILETLTVARWSWRTENIYWMETSTGLIRRSIQHIAADMPAITIDLLRPPM